jgi:2-hydroxychromene-2-carboxylate isomerase
VVKEAYRDARRYAEHQGLTLKGPLKVWDSSFASMALIWSQSKAPTRHHLQRFMTTLFQRFWIRDFDLQDIQALCALMQASAIESDGFNRFCAEEGRQQHDALQEQLLAQGVYGVPTFLIDDEVFFGREQIDTGVVAVARLGGTHAPITLPLGGQRQCCNLIVVIFWWICERQNR